MAETPETQSAEESPTPLPNPPHWAVDALNSALPGTVLEVVDALGETTITVELDSILEVMAALKTAGVNFMEDVTCTDWFPSEPRFQVVYHLLNMGRKQRVRVKVQVFSGDTAVNSITPVWPSADFYEREVFDLFGIRFGGHPNMRRILMPDDWEGYPLRKDYPVEGYR